MGYDVVGLEHIMTLGRYMNVGICKLYAMIPLLLFDHFCMTLSLSSS